MDFRTRLFACTFFATLGTAPVTVFAEGNESFVGLSAIENGDANGDWGIDISDPVYLFRWLYQGGPALVPLACGPDASLANGDTNGDSEIDMSDGIHLLSYIFLAGPAPMEFGCSQVSGAGGGAASQRPISDFVSPQGTFCQDILGDGSCYLFVAPAPNFLGWTNDTDTNNDGVQDKPLLFAGVDYAGLANGYFGNLLGTTLEGSVTEVPMADGRAHVSVLLRARQANGWVIALDLAGDVLGQIADGPTLFGHRPEDVALGAGAALGDSFLNVDFINTAPGAPLPDLLQLSAAPLAGQELKTLRFLWRAAGPLTALYGVSEGTPGRCTIQQNGVLVPGSSNHLVGGDGFPAEFINLTATSR